MHTHSRDPSAALEKRNGDVGLHTECPVTVLGRGFDAANFGNIRHYNWTPGTELAQPALAEHAER